MARAKLVTLTVADERELKNRSGIQKRILEFLVFAVRDIVFPDLGSQPLKLFIVLERIGWRLTVRIIS